MWQGEQDNRPLDAKSLNSRSALAMRENQSLAAAAMSAAKANMNAASEYLHCLNGIDPQDILDIKVTCDGTWSRRGFTAIHGVVVVISWDTGQVLDFEVMSKSCMLTAEDETGSGGV